MAIESSTTTTVTRSSTAASVGLLLLRIPLGAYFIFAAVGKLKMGGAAFTETFITKVPSWMPPDLGRMYLNALPWMELTVGILVTVGLLTRVAAAAMALMLVSFTIAVTGVSGKLADTVNLPFHPNLVYLGSALALTLCGPGWISLDGLLFRPRRRVVVTEETERRVGP